MLGSLDHSFRLTQVIEAFCRSSLSCQHPMLLCKQEPCILFGEVALHAESPCPVSVSQCDAFLGPRCLVHGLLTLLGQSKSQDFAKNAGTETHLFQAGCEPMLLATILWP